MRHQNFIDRDKLYTLLENSVPTAEQIDNILNKARQLKGLHLADVAKLLCVEDAKNIQKISIEHKTLIINYLHKK